MTTPAEEWVADAHKALKLFINHIGEIEWNRRRKNVVDYFRSVKTKGYTTEEILTGDVKKLFSPIAVYDDWISWYMYLVECMFLRPFCNDPLQSARIYPFFSAIGRNIDILKSIKGYEDRLKVMLNEKQNQPDTTLYELVVALQYHSNGWEVEFLEDHPSRKTPDIKVVRGNQEFFVECKRLGKVNDYSEQERIEWQKRSRHLNLAMRTVRIPVFVDIIFKVPVENTPEHILAQMYTQLVSSTNRTMRGSVSTSELEMKISPINLKKINERLGYTSALANSPQLVELLVGEYHAGEKYVLLASPSEIQTVGVDDGLEVLNEYWGGLHEAYALRWDTISPISIDLKAKDVKRHLFKAVNQIPDGKQGIVHIGFETVDGPVVELARHKKISETVNAFEYKPKKIAAVYCNALQLLAKVEGYDWAETNIFFERDGINILSNKMVLAPEETIEKNTTHWEQDLGL